MTPKQYYFPYFFNLNSFNKEIKLFGLSSYVKRDDKGMVQSLAIIRYKLFQSLRSKYDLIEIPFGMTLMVHQDNLLFWKTDYNVIDLFRVNLEKLKHSPEKLHDKIRIKMSANCYDCKPIIELANFVTYVRMDELKYETDFHEKFAVIIIDNSHIQTIPFDSFNKNGGDCGYVWPATARLDFSTLKIHGQGMRMNDFIIDLSSQGEI